MKLDAEGHLEWARGGGFPKSTQSMTCTLDRDGDAVGVAAQALGTHVQTCPQCVNIDRVRRREEPLEDALELSSDDLQALID